MDNTNQFKTRIMSKLTPEQQAEENARKNLIVGDHNFKRQCRATALGHAINTRKADEPSEKVVENAAKYFDFLTLDGNTEIAAAEKKFEFV